MIKEENGRWYVYNHSGSKRLPPENGYSTEKEAGKRLGQIEFFKNQDEALIDAMCVADEFEDAEYKGKDVTLNKPFRTPSESKKFAVYVKNERGNVIKVRFGDPDMEIKRDNPEDRKNFRSRHNCSEKDDRTTPGYWSCRMWSSKPVSKIADSAFTHKVFFDLESKRIRSVRDGVQEYLGVELGMEPHDKVFTVYRSPATIANLADQLDGLPITYDHVDVNSASEVDKKDIVGSIKDTEVLEFLDDTTDSTLLLENAVAVDDRAIASKNAGKKEFSLGYLGGLIPHDVYDFEQYITEPTHLGLVDSARGGSVLTFVDKKESKMGDKALSKVFLDADGNPNLQQIVEIAQELPEALKKVPVDKLQEMIPMLQEIVTMGGETMTEQVSEMMSDEEKDKIMDMDYEDMEGEEKDKFSDSKLFKSIVKSSSASFQDSKAFADAVAKSNKAHAEVIEKARKFVQEGYSFADKSTEEIMRDAIKAEHGETKFEDSELSVAFKLLKSSDSSLRQFGDRDVKSNLEKRIEENSEG